jgi:hypothetical protein
VAYKVKRMVSPEAAVTEVGVKVKPLLSATETLNWAAWTADAAKRAKVVRRSI